ERVNGGEFPLAGREPELPEMIARVVASARLRATTDYGALADADVVLVDVDTPLSADRQPRFEKLQDACISLAAVAQDGVLVVVESTVAPGTCERLVAPIFEGRNFLLGHCPERLMRGRLLANLHDLARACGGSSNAACDAMVA